MKQFYEFEQTPFRNELMKSFILPAIEWLLGDPKQPYLLPQMSSSHWECAIIIESLLKAMNTNSLIEPNKKALIENKMFQTVNWLMEEISYNKNDNTCNWDDATWDTAICTRCLFLSEKYFESKYSEEQKNKLIVIKYQLIKWLIKRGINWDKDVRYPAGPPDLAQVLNTLILFADQYPLEIKKIEEEFSWDSEENILDRITRIIMSMQEQTYLIVDNRKEQLSFWVDCFNTSEVAEALSAYINHHSYEKDRKLVKKVKKSLYRSVRYIEENQDSGTWGGVADSCGTLYGYLQVTKSLNEIGPKDYIVFQALRWMCDRNQVFSDGSFLHSSYITVFYLLALVEAYSNWELGKKNTLEVYDIALWNIPAQGTSERSKRLELQLKIEDREQQFDNIKNEYSKLEKKYYYLIWIVVEVSICVILLMLMDYLSIDLKQIDRLYMILPIFITVIITITPALVKYRNSKKNL